MIRPAVLAGLSLLLAAWNAEGAPIYRRAAARPPGAAAALGGPAAKPSAVIGGPAEAKPGLPGGGGSRTPGAAKVTHRSRAGAPVSGGGAARAFAPAAAGQGASQGQPSAAGLGRPAPKGKFDARSARR